MINLLEIKCNLIIKLICFSLSNNILKIFVLVDPLCFSFFKLSRYCIGWCIKHLTRSGMSTDID